MNKSVEVAVILCVYKNDKLDFILEAMNSIIHQTYKHVSIYIFQDGPVSIDIKCYLDELSVLPNVTLLVSENNVGLAVGLNSLIDIVMADGRAKYVARMDSDDISRLDRFEKQVRFMEENPTVDVSGGYCREFGAKFALSEKKVPLEHIDLVDFSIARCPFIHPTVVFRTSLFNDGTRYPTHTSMTEDMALWLLLIKGGKVFANIPEVLLDYRVSDAVITRRMGFKKGFSEFIIRYRFMLETRRITVKNTLLVVSRLFFHCFPKSLVKICYARLR